MRKGTPTNPVVCSMSEAMCAECQHRIITRGWRPEDERAWRDAPDSQSCDACRDGILHLAYEHDAIKFETYRDWSARQYDELAALHEAAHAVVGEGLGLVMTEAAIENDEIDVFGSTVKRAGSVRWDTSKAIFSLNWAAMAAAGHALNLEWQRRNGFTGPRYLIDAAHSSGADTATILQTAYDRGEDVERLLRNGSGIASEIVAEDWAQITAVADELGRTGRMDRSAVRTAMSRSHHAAPSPAPEPHIPASTPVSGGTAMSGIEEIRGTLSRATEETEQAQRALAEAVQRIESARAAVAQAALSSSRDEIQQALAAYGHVDDSLREVGGRMAASADQVRTYAAQL